MMVQEYKETPIGKIPKDWKVVKLGKVLSLRNGQRPKISEDGSIPVYGANGVMGHTTEFLADNDFTVVIGRVGTSGEVYLGQGKIWVSDNAIYSENYNGSAIHPFFIYYLLKSKNLGRFASKTTHSIITQTFLNHFPIPLPPFEEQRRIVARIEKFNSKIEEIKKLKKISKEKSEKVMQAALHKIFSKAEERGWEWVKIGEACNKINPSKGEIRKLSDETEVTFVPMKAVSEEGKIVDPEVRCLGEVRNGYTYFKEKDVLYAKITPCMENGKTAIARGLINGIGFGSTEFHVLRVSPKIIPKFIHYYIRRKSFREKATRSMTGTAGQKRVPKDFMKNEEIPLPSIEEQEKIITYLDNVKRSMESLRMLLRRTDKDIEDFTPAILDKAFKGEL